jgi:hypothetical protein
MAEAVSDVSRGSRRLEGIPALKRLFVGINSNDEHEALAIRR